MPPSPAPVPILHWDPALSETFTTAVGDDAVLTSTTVQMGATGAHPLVIITHGSGGNIENLGWLAHGLVASKAIVAGVNHPCATLGDSSPGQLPRIGDRTQDIAALIATFTAGPAFAPMLDPVQISTLGFSLGGPLHWPQGVRSLIPRQSLITVSGSATVPLNACSSTRRRKPIRSATQNRCRYNSAQSFPCHCC